MARTASTLTGSRGWTTLGTLTTILCGVVALQLPSANAAGPAAPAPAAATVAVAAVQAARTAPVAVRPASLPAKPVAKTVAKPVVKPAVKPAAKRAVTPAAAKPVVKPAPARSDLCAGTGWQARRGQAALDSLRAGAARTGFSVSFSAARKGYMGLTHLEERRIEVFVRSCDSESTDLLKHVMAHELGHAYDTSRMTAASRSAYLAARGIAAGTPWYGCSSCTDFATPAGDFAEVYAQWARGASTNLSRIAGDATAAQLASLASQFFGA